MQFFFLGQILVGVGLNFLGLRTSDNIFFPPKKKSDPYIFILIFFEDLLVVSRVLFFRNFHDMGKNATSVLIYVNLLQVKKILSVTFLLNFHRRQVGPVGAVFYQGKEFVPQRRVLFKNDPCVKRLVDRRLKLSYSYRIIPYSFFQSSNFNRT